MSDTGPRSQSEYDDCRMAELETALEAERDKVSAARALLSDLSDELASMRETCDERIADIDKYLSKK